MTLMSYTNALTIRNAMGGLEATQDTLLDNFAGIASRSMDHLCAQTDDVEAENYFFQETVIGEQLTNGLIDRYGHLICYPHKSSIQSVQSISWTSNPNDGWLTPDTTNSVIVKPHSVEVWEDLSVMRDKPFLISITYLGGMATVLTGLSQTIVDVATIIAIRKFKEERSGMSDVVGVVELGTVQYSKGIPASVVAEMKPFIRVWPWM